MAPDHIRAEVVGTYPVRFRDGPGEPLIVFHPHHVSDAEAWMARRPPAGRPLAVFGTGDMVGFTCDAEQVVRDLVRHTGWRQAESVEIAGASIGGFPALLYGAMLAMVLPKARVSITTISPLVCMWPLAGGARAERHERVVKLLRRRPEQRRRMNRYGDTRPWIERAFAALGDRLRIRVLYAAHNERDAAQADLLSGFPCVTLLPVPTAQHSLGAALRREETGARLLAVLRNRMAARHPDLPPTELLARAERVAEAILGLHRDIPEVLDLLEVRARHPA